MVEVEQQHKSELLTVSSTFDLYWYAVHEHMVKDGEEKPEGVGGIGGVSVEHLGVLKKSDLSAELRRLECGEWLCVCAGEGVFVCAGGGCVCVCVFDISTADRSLRSM